MIWLSWWRVTEQNLANALLHDENPNAALHQILIPRSLRADSAMQPMPHRIEPVSREPGTDRGQITGANGKLGLPQPHRSGSWRSARGSKSDRDSEHLSDNVGPEQEAGSHQRHIPCSRLSSASRHAAATCSCGRRGAHVERLMGVMGPMGPLDMVPNARFSETARSYCQVCWKTG